MSKRLNRAAAASCPPEAHGGISRSRVELVFRASEELRATQAQSALESTPSSAEIEEDDARRIADRRVAAGECQAAGLAVDSENGDVVGPLVAAVEEPAGGVEVEAARI